MHYIFIYWFQTKREFKSTTFFSANVLKYISNLEHDFLIESLFSFQEVVFMGKPSKLRSRKHLSWEEKVRYTTVLQLSSTFRRIILKQRYLLNSYSNLTVYVNAICFTPHLEMWKSRGRFANVAFDRKTFDW